MAEVAGLAVGVVGLASIFSACASALRKVESYREFRLESNVLKAQFESANARFTRWGRAAGLEEPAKGSFKEQEGELRMEAVTAFEAWQQKHCLIQDERTAAVVEQILICIKALFGAISGSRTGALDATFEYGSVHPPDASREPIGKDKKNANRSASRVDRVFWALGRKRHVQEQVETFSALVSELENIVPVDSQSRSHHQSESKAEDAAREVQTTLQDIGRQLQVVLIQDFVSALGSVSSRDTFEKLRESRAPGTCTWMLGKNELKQWATGVEVGDTSRLLWINGPAGFGKSVLCASLIDHLQSSVDTKKIAYFFCSADVEDQRKPISIVRSWLHDLLTGNSSDPKVFHLISERLEIRPGQPISDAEAWQLLELSLQMIPGVFLVLDGLDECIRPESHWKYAEECDRGIFLSRLRRALVRGNTRCLITSRNEIDIRAAMRSSEPMEQYSQALLEYSIRTVDVSHDTAKYSRCLVDEKLPKKSGDLKFDLATLMSEKSDGMFLWLRLLSRELRGSKTRKQLYDIISEMPVGLERAFERDLNRIANLPARDRQRALDVLRWVVFAARPLQVNELIEALVVPDRNEILDLDVDELPDEIDDEYIQQEILGLCGSLLEMRNLEGPHSARQITVAHFSVKEFLLCRLPQDLKFCDPEYENNALAKRCIRYLFYPLPWTNDNKISDGRDHKNFLGYASSFWLRHVSKVGSNYHEVMQLAKQFFDPSNSHWDLWHEKADFSTLLLGAKTHVHFLLEMNIGRSSRLTTAAILGLEPVLDYLVNQTNGDIEIKGINNGIYGICTPLHAACVAGQLGCVDFFLELGTDINAESPLYGSPSNVAANTGSHELLERMLNKGADLSIADARGFTPLLTSVRQNRKFLVRTLLEHGADPSAVDVSGKSALIMAVGNTEIIKLLLKAGARASTQNEEGNTALHRAAIKGATESAKLLLRQPDANLDVKNIKGRTPLHCGVKSRNKAMITTLLASGANPSTKDNDGVTLLDLATSNGDADIVELLVNEGASVVEKGYRDGTPLHFATASKSITIVEFLLKKGSPVMLANQKGVQPAHIAAQWKSSSIMQLLNNNGACLTSTDKNGFSPLHYAARAGAIENVRYLISLGVPPHVKSASGALPLYFAARNGHCEVAKILMEEGAKATCFTKGDQLSQNFKYMIFPSLKCAIGYGHNGFVELFARHGALQDIHKSAQTELLQLAFFSGNDRVIRILLGSGADLELTDWRGRNLLHIICQCWRSELFENFFSSLAEKLLVSDLLGRSALHHAAIGDSVEGIKWALSKGLDANEPDRSDWTALHWAAYCGSRQATEELLASGANGNARDLNGRTPYGIARLTSGQGGLLIKRLAESLKPSPKGDLSLPLGLVGGFCDCCDVELREGMYHCRECKEFDLCFRCGLDRDVLHPKHSFQTDFEYPDFGLETDRLYFPH